MDEVITCTVLGIGSVAHGDVDTNPSGRQIWIGVRVRTSAGKSHFFPGMLVEAEAAVIVRDAMENGEPVQLWLTGKEQRAYPYGVRTAADEWYYDGYAGYLSGQGFKFLVLSILTLPLLGIGLLILPTAISYFMSASTFTARRSQATFDRGSAGGAPEKDTGGTSGERLQAA